MKNLPKYAKALVAVAAVLAAVGKAFVDGHASSEELGVVFGAVVTAYGVYRVPNSKA
jgi:uncharacterized membrane protein YfcA